MTKDEEIKKLKGELDRVLGRVVALDKENDDLKHAIKKSETEQAKLREDLRSAEHRINHSVYQAELLKGICLGMSHKNTEMRDFLMNCGGID